MPHGASSGPAFWISRFPIAIGPRLCVGWCGAQARWVLLQLRVLSFGLPQNRDVGVCVLPESEEVLIGCKGFAGVTLHCGSSADLQMCERSDGFTSNNLSLGQDFLELRYGFASLMRRQISFPAYVGRKHDNEVGVGTQLVGDSGL
jgi:hypothetical protein